MFQFTPLVRGATAANVEVCRVFDVVNTENDAIIPKIMSFRCQRSMILPFFAFLIQLKEAESCANLLGKSCGLGVRSRGSR